MSALESDRYARLRRARAPRVVPTVAITGYFMLHALPFLLGFPGLWVALLPLAALIATVVYSWLPARVEPVAGGLSAGPEGVRWDGELLAPRGQIAAGLVVPGGGPLEVRLLRRFPRRPVAFAAADEVSARALLQALGLDATQTAVSLPFASRLRASPAAAVLWPLSLFALPLALLIAVIFAFAVPSAGGTLAAGAIGLVSMAWAVLNLAGSTVRIGADGILVTWLGTETFVAYDELEGIERYAGNAGAGLVLRLRGGRVVRLPRMGAFAASLDVRELDLVVRRVQEAVEHEQRAQVDRGIVLPERGGRPTAAWIAALRAVGSGARSDHRTAPVGADRLLRIAEDPGAAPEMRAAAAVALGSVADETSRGRLRIAADATAEPDLRAAIALAAEADAEDEALGAALDRLGRRRAS